MPRYKLIKYPHPTTFDGQTVPLSIFSNKNELIGKTITITVSDMHKEKLDLINEPNIINKSIQEVYATRREDIFARIIHIFSGCKARVEIISNPYLNDNNNPNALFFVHDTRSTPFYEHSKCITAFIDNGITMNSDLVSYFKYSSFIDDFGSNVNDDRDWIDQSFFDHVHKTATQGDLDILNKLQRKNIISEELYNQYVKHYLPLSNMYEKVLDIIDTREVPKYDKHPYYPKFDEYRSRLSKKYSSYGYKSTHTESRYLKPGDQLDIIFENIHFFPLDINNMNDYRDFDYVFGRIPVPMAWNGALFEDRDSILSALEIGNIVRCPFDKLDIKRNRQSCGRGVWYFSIILIADDVIFGSLRDFYYDPKLDNLQAGMILIFKKDNITEIPHQWSQNQNLNHFTTSNVGYAVTGYVCEINETQPDPGSHVIS